MSCRPNEIGATTLPERAQLDEDSIIALLFFYFATKKLEARRVTTCLRELQSRLPALILDSQVNTPILLMLHHDPHHSLVTLEAREVESLVRGMSERQHKKSEPGTRGILRR